jgi:nucleoside-diphosphate-sugar epimerase
MKVLVTGGGGLIGRWAVDRLVADGHEVVSIGRAASERSAEVRPATREVIGEISDTALVNREMADGIDAVLHLAAIPAPVGRTTVELLAANNLTTMTVLEAAGNHGVRTVVLASSISALGMAWSEAFMHPLYVPIDEEHGLRPTEGYALSKENDEAAARMANRRWNTTVVAFRFPFTGTRKMIDERAARVLSDRDQAIAAAKELWAYLDVRDAAIACEQALIAGVEGRVTGVVVLNVMADDVIIPQPLADLLGEWHPDVPVTGDLGRGAYNVNKARDLLGFAPQYLLSTEF